jgi:ribosomal protein S21
MAEVRKKPQESIGSLLRRFSERVRKSGVLQEAREVQTFRRLKSKRLRRQDAVERSKISKSKEYLRKLGKL